VAKSSCRRTPVWQRHKIGGEKKTLRKRVEVGFFFCKNRGRVRFRRRRAIVWAVLRLSAGAGVGFVAAAGLASWTCSWIGRWPQSLCFVRRSRLVEAATDSWRNAGGERAPKVVARGLFSRSFMVCSELCFLGRCMLLACCLWADVRLCSGGSCSGFRTTGNVFSFSTQCCCYYWIVAKHRLTSLPHHRYHVLFDSWVFFRLRKSRFERFVSSSFS
jgi:hypothetical protein